MRQPEAGEQLFPGAFSGQAGEAGLSDKIDDQVQPATGLNRHRDNAEMAHLYEALERGRGAADDLLPVPYNLNLIIGDQYGLMAGKGRGKAGCYQAEGKI